MQTFFLGKHSPEAGAIYQDLDNKCIHWLGMHGLPPAIPEWDGWYTPTTEDVGCIHMLWITEEDHDHYCLDDSRDCLLAGEDPHFDQLFAQRAADDPMVDWEATTRRTADDEEMGESTAGPAAPTDVLPFAEGMDLGEDGPPCPPSPSPLSTPLSST